MQTKKIEDIDIFMQDLIHEVVKNSEKSISPYYKYQVCAAIVDEDNKIYKGVNWEMAAENICGEVGAIAAYVQSERKKIKSVVTYGHPCQGNNRDNSYCTPCGNCRQRLNEFCNKDTIIYCVNETATEAQIFSMKEILPYSFNSSNLIGD